VRAPVNGLWRMLVGKAARGSRRLLRAPINGVRRRVRGPAAGPKRGLLADFHETQKTPVAGIISGATALKIHTACRRDAFFSASAVISALKYIKYLECHGSRRSVSETAFSLVFPATFGSPLVALSLFEPRPLEKPFFFKKSVTFPRPRRCRRKTGVLRETATPEHVEQQH